MKHLSITTNAALLAFGLSLAPLRAQDAPKPLDLLVQTLNRVENPEAQANILRGMDISLKGRHGLAAPAGWDALYDKLRSSPNAEVRREALALGVTFGGKAALEEMRKTLTDAAADPAARHAALESLLSMKDAPLLPFLLTLAKEPGPLRAAALRGLAEYEDAQIPSVILGVFKTLDTTEKRDAVNTLLARPASAQAFLAAIDAQTLSRSEINAPAARQLQDLHNKEIDAWLAKNWGAVRTSPADKQAQIARLKAFLTPDSILRADVNRGRAIFTQTCAICHTLFGYGAKIGPELPGSFEDIDYLLLNIVDPDAIIGKDYQQVLVHTKDGQTVSGIIASDDANAVSLKSLAGVVTVQRADITSMEVSPHSLMPEGLITGLDPQTVRDLFLYLRQRAQVPLLATPVNAGDFFNGNDLARWHASADNGWKVENGEIVGRGTANKATWLKSDMIAGDFKFTAMLKLAGADPMVEIAYHGLPDMTPFLGESLSLGRNARANVWHYLRDGKARSTMSGKIVKTGEWTKCEIESKGVQTTINLDDILVLFFLSPPNPARNGFAIYLQGAGSEVRLKDVKLEVPESSAMRGIVAGGWMIFLALTAWAGDAPGWEVAPDGGFVPRGSGIRVAFRFAEMVSTPPSGPAAPRAWEGFGEFLRAGAWADGHGVTARVDLCLVNHQAVLSEEVLAAARLRLGNTSAKPCAVTLAVTLTPEKTIHSLAFEAHAFSIAGRTVLVADTPRGAILADSPFAPRALTPRERAHVESVQGECRGEMIYDLTLAPGQTQTLGFICPLGLFSGNDPGPDFYHALAVEDLFAEAAKQHPPP